MLFRSSLSSFPYFNHIFCNVSLQSSLHNVAAQEKENARAAVRHTIIIVSFHGYYGLISIDDIGQPMEHVAVDKAAQ